ncbi:MAG: ABC transporter substrate-binding protein [Pseudomonadota bacterium]
MRPILLLCLGLFLASPANATEPEPARATAERLVEETYAALTASTPDDARLKAAIEAAFAFDIWEQFLLGERAAALSPAQQERFRALLPGFLADLYKTQFGQGLAGRPEIRDVRAARRDQLVRAAIPREGADPLPVDWRVRAFGEAHKVIDVMVGGVSFLVLKREEFAAILKREGGDGLLAHMEANSL